MYSTVNLCQYDCIQLACNENAHIPSLTMLSNWSIISIANKVDSYSIIKNTVINMKIHPTHWPFCDDLYAQTVMLLFTYFAFAWKVHAKYPGKQIIQLRRTGAISGAKAFHCRDPQSSYTRNPLPKILLAINEIICEGP